MKKKDPFFYILTIAIVVGYFTTLVAMIIKGGHDTTVNIMVGTLGAAFMAVVSYNFGTTKSGADKTDMIYHSTPRDQRPAPEVDHQKNKPTWEP